MRLRRTVSSLGPVGAFAVAALAILLATGCGDAAGGSGDQTSKYTETSMATQLPPLDLEAPAEYQTATFAFG